MVSLKTLKDLVAEYKGTGLAYKRRVHNVMRASFANHYRRLGTEFNNSVSSALWRTGSNDLLARREEFYLYLFSA